MLAFRAPFLSFQRPCSTQTVTLACCGRTLIYTPIWSFWATVAWPITLNETGASTKVWTSSAWNKCQRCSSFFSALKATLRWLLNLPNECERLFSSLPNDGNRIASLNSKSPDCICERSTTSKHSPRPVGEEEVLARFVFDPIHVSRDGALKSSLFSHVNLRGCSVQRDTVATHEELVAFVQSFLTTQLTKKRDTKWHSVVIAPCKKIRSLMQGSATNRSVCVFDTAERTNPAHAELFQTQYVIDEADQLELRKVLLTSFSDCLTPSQFRNGAVLSTISPELRKHCHS